jgi:hypothetical protein
MPLLSDLAGVGQPVQQLASMAPQPTLPSANLIEQAYRDRLDNDYEGLKAEYAALLDEKGRNVTEGGTVLNTDLAREMSPDYRADRTKSADVHEPSSDFVKRMYAEKLSQPTPSGKDNTVIFTAGGTGAGKSTGLDLVKNVNDDVRRAEMTYDTNMNTYDSADKKIQQALQAGRKVGILYTYRDPVDALVNGALERANRMERDLGTGRTVPIDEHFKTHAGALDVMKKLQDKYGDDHRFHMMIIDNSHGKGNAKVVSSLDKIPEMDHNKVRNDLNEALESHYRQGKISTAIYRGTKGT